jgi:DNA-binding MarR family transcriptional regulator/GNAT superfamily N-acetyltransferase
MLPDVSMVRGFNRFYTRQLGLLQPGYLHSPFSLTEVRVLYELAHREGVTATELASELGLDAGYLSRILLRFRKKALVSREASERDGRSSHLSLTAKGRKAFTPLEDQASEEIAATLKQLSPGDREKLTAAMRTIEGLLDPAPKPAGAYILRDPRAGDIGYIAHRHGVLYWEEYGYDITFEALVAEIASQFVKNFDARYERCWIAEKDGAIAGSIFLVKKSKTVAKLRLLLVEPSARGLGIGKRLVEECLRFAREAGYKKVVLWTQNDLYAARGIYEKAGFACVAEEPHHSFGKDLVAETWEIDLTAEQRRAD